MLSRRTIAGPCTGYFHTPVWTVLPRQDTSVGMPTFTDSRVGIGRSFVWHGQFGRVGRCRSCLPDGGRLVERKVAVDAVRDHVLAGLQLQSYAVEVQLDLVRLERHQPRDAPYLGPGVLIRPRRAAGAGDVVVAGQALVRAERLGLDRGQRGRVDVGARDVPAGREPGLVQDQGAGGVGDDLVAAAHDKVAAGLADVDAVVAV